MKATNSEALIDSLTLDGYLYGVPFTTNTWYMFYDKRVFSEEDVKNLDTMLEKGVVSFPFTNSLYLPAFYFDNGCTLFGDGTQAELGADFGGENAVEVTEYLLDLVQNPNFRIDQDGSGIAGLRDGSISAMFSGSWMPPPCGKSSGKTWAWPLSPPTRSTVRKSRCTLTPDPRRSA